MPQTTTGLTEVDGERLDSPGTRVEVDFIDAIVVADGLVQRKDGYLDTLSFERRLGAAA